MEELKKDRANIKRALRRFEKVVRDSNSVDHVAPLKVSLDRNLSLIREYNKVQADIEALLPDDQLEAEDADRSKFEREYDIAIGNARVFIDSHEQSNIAANTSVAPQSNSVFIGNHNDSSNNSDVMLKRVDIPKFDGDFSKWVKFRDTLSAFTVAKV